MTSSFLSYLGLFIIILLCCVCFFSALGNLRNLKKENDPEIKSQKIISSIGLLVFGGGGLIVLIFLFILF